VVYDDDHYYLGGVLAEHLVQQGCTVTLITPSAYVSEWTINTLEQESIHRRLAGCGVNIILNRGITRIAADHVISNCSYTDTERSIECDAVLMLASRVGRDTVHTALLARESDWPGPIAWATYAGHRFARDIDSPDIGDALPFRRELTALAFEIS